MCHIEKKYIQEIISTGKKKKSIDTKKIDIYIQVLIDKSKSRQIKVLFKTIFFFFACWFPLNFCAIYHNYNINKKNKKNWWHQLKCRQIYGMHHYHSMPENPCKLNSKQFHGSFFVLLDIFHFLKFLWKSYSRIKNDFTRFLLV